VVPDYQLSLAIGKEGQNARLAARLTGWRIDIRSDTAAPAGSVAATGPAAGAGTGTDDGGVLTADSRADGGDAGSPAAGRDGGTADATGGRAGAAGDADPSTR
jgi:N utilization substance protein A